MIASFIYCLYEQFFKNYSPNFLQRLLYKCQKVPSLLTITSVRRVAASSGTASDSVSLISVLQLGQMMVGSVMGVLLVRRVLWRAREFVRVPAPVQRHVHKD